VFIFVESWMDDGGDLPLQNQKGVSIKLDSSLLFISNPGLYKRRF